MKQFTTRSKFTALYMTHANYVDICQALVISEKNLSTFLFQNVWNRPFLYFIDWNVFVSYLEIDVNYEPLDVSLLHLLKILKNMENRGWDMSPHLGNVLGLPVNENIKCSTKAHIFYSKNTISKCQSVVMDSWLELKLQTSLPFDFLKALTLYPLSSFKNTNDKF